MKGPYSLAAVRQHVAGQVMGAYVLSRDGEAAHYVGRSDVDLAARIAASAREGTGYRFFWFEYATSPRGAYLLECEWYHRYEPSDNGTHPAVPPGTSWRCPQASCAWS